MTICLRKDTYTQTIDLIIAQMGLVINEDDLVDIWVSYIKDGVAIKQWGGSKAVHVHPVKATCAETVLCTFHSWEHGAEPIRHEGSKYFAVGYVTEMCRFIYDFLQSPKCVLPEGVTQ